MAGTDKREQTHRERVYRPLEFQKRCELSSARTTKRSSTDGRVCSLARKIECARASLRVEKMLIRRRNLGSIGDMKPQTTVLTLALCLFRGGVALRRRSTDGYVEAERN